MRRVAPFIDLVVVVVFVAIGRERHHHGDALKGLVSTSWPFALGLAVAWLVLSRRSRRGLSLRDGALVVIVTVAIGMVARVLAGQGTAFAFILVALAFLGLAMEGWRLIARRVSRHH
ncbi:MAG TPA: DUF3054 domain-containing protein [Acidimicrobiales bacterium]|nr:DUF3054 domain-containing protein [Acidimicrobiales bacterium]